MKIRKYLSLLFVVLFSYAIKAETIIFNYVGDGKPVQVEIESKSNLTKEETIQNTNKENTFLNQYIKSQITFNFDDKTSIGVIAKFKIEQVNSELKIYGETLNKEVIRLQKKITSEKIDRIQKKKIIQYEISVKFENFNEKFSEFKKGMSDLDFKDNLVVFHTSNLENTGKYFLSVEISKLSIFKNEKVIFRKNLNLKDADFTQEKIGEERFRNTIDLKRITKGDVNLNQNVTIKVIFKTSENISDIINIDQNMPLSFEKTIKNQ